jgi:D-sedoheptulose 7-phosphate isomerase
MTMYSTYLEETRKAINELADDPRHLNLIEAAADLLCSRLAAGGKVLFAGNGGSAADCQHLAGELVVRFRHDRPALPGIALTVDTSVLTACLNDFGPNPVFSRQVAALGRAGDVLWVFSTSGTSPNILEACGTAKSIGMAVLGFTGRDGGRLPELCDLCFRAPADATSQAQECHITVGHMLCLAVEERLFVK